jgi:hypothetical protein
MDLGSGLVVNVQQETDYPSSGKVLLKVDPSQPAEFSLHLRIPRWCQGAKVAVNGQPVEGPVRSGTYCSISRKWLSGARVELDMPMPLRFVRGRHPLFAPAAGRARDVGPRGSDPLHARRPWLARLSPPGCQLWQSDDQGGHRMVFRWNAKADTHEPTAELPDPAVGPVSGFPPPWR